MAIEGPLRELGIHDVFQLLDLSRKTGVLRVTSELRHNAGTIYFQDGTIIFAEIKSNPHPLGALLLRTGKITEADLERARDMQTRQNDPRRLGQILVAMGVLSPREVERQVRFQIEEVVFEVMSWREGVFSFSEEPVTGVPAETAVRISTEALLMEGARRIDEWFRIEKHVPHLGVVPAPAARRDLEQARATAEQAVALYPHDATVHLLLGRIHLAAVRPPEAVEELRRALRLDPLLAAAHRLLGHALAAAGRFGEAVDQWEQWERLASRSEQESARLEEVQRAKAAAQTLAKAGTVSHG